MALLYPGRALHSAAGRLPGSCLVSSLRQRQARAAILAISSLGLALILQNLIRMLWGPQAQYYSRAIHFPFTVPVLQVRLNTQQILIFAIALGLVMLVSLFLQRTKLGKAMRATSDNFSLALVSGIDTELVVILTWLLGAGLAAAGGVLLGMSVRLQPIMGWDLLYRSSLPPSWAASGVPTVPWRCGHHRPR